MRFLAAAVRAVAIVILALGVALLLLLLGAPVWAAVVIGVLVIYFGRLTRWRKRST